MEPMPSSTGELYRLVEVEMAEKIFLMLNGTGVVFLIWVLIEFLKEGWRSRVTGQCSCQFAPARGIKSGSVPAALAPLAMARMQERTVIQFRTRNGSPSESKLAAKFGGLGSGSPSKGYGTR
jgi:hypothetical protein